MGLQEEKVRPRAGQGRGGVGGRGHRGTLLASVSRSRCVLGNEASGKVCLAKRFILGEPAPALPGPSSARSPAHSPEEQLLATPGLW